nr:hypothetical protein [Tanacetum cinerariifolium]
MRDEHLSTIAKTELNELIKSSVDNLVPNPSESEDLSNIGSECSVPVGDNFTTFSYSLFDADDNFSSSDDESFSDEDIDYLLEEFSGELAHIDLISSRINKADFDPEEEIRLVKKLLIAWILKTHARGFVLRSLNLQILSFILGIQYPNLID